MTDEETPEGERVAALERRLVEMEEAHRGALLRSGLKAEALRAGMVDLDGLKLVDTTEVAVDATGDIVGAAALMVKLRRAKPWLFGLQIGSTTTSTASAPPAQGPQQRRATDMTHEEWQAARAELLRRT